MRRGRFADANSFVPVRIGLILVLALKAFRFQFVSPRLCHRTSHGPFSTCTKWSRPSCSALSCPVYTHSASYCGSSVRWIRWNAPLVDRAIFRRGSRPGSVAGETNQSNFRTSCNQGTLSWDLLSSFTTRVKTARFSSSLYMCVRFLVVSFCPFYSSLSANSFVLLYSNRNEYRA